MTVVVEFATWWSCNQTLKQSLCVFVNDEQAATSVNLLQINAQELAKAISRARDKAISYKGYMWKREYDHGYHRGYQHFYWPRDFTIFHSEGSCRAFWHTSVISKQLQGRTKASRRREIYSSSKSRPLLISVSKSP